MIQQNDMTSYVDTTHKIVLAKSNDVFSYEPELITTLTNALFFKQLDFPFREKGSGSVCRNNRHICKRSNRTEKTIS